MGTFKDKKRIALETEKEEGSEVFEKGKQKVAESLSVKGSNANDWEDVWESVDDEDAQLANLIELEGREKPALGSIIPDETPLYISGPGFDDCLSPEETAYIRKKHLDINLADSVPYCFEAETTSVSSDDLRMSPDDSVSSLQDIARESELIVDELQENAKQLVICLEDLF